MWLCKTASRIGILIASGGAYIRTIRSYLTSCEYVRSSRTYVCSSRRKFVTLALWTCREASRATRKVFIAVYRISWLILCQWLAFGARTARRVSMLWTDCKLDQFVNRPLQTWPVCKWATTVLQFFNWLAHFQSYKVISFRNQIKQFETWPNGLEGYKQPKRHESTSLPNKQQSVAQTTWGWPNDSRACLGFCTGCA